MARKRLKKNKVETITHKETGATVDIYLIDLKFEAALPTDVCLTDSDGKRLIRRVHEWLNNNATPDWQPVIEVTPLFPFAHEGGGFIGFAIDRFYWAKRPYGDGYLKIENWEHDPREWDGDPLYNPLDLARDFSVKIEGHAPFEPPCKSHRSFGDETIYLPYTEETWAGLEQMLDAIDELNQNLSTMLSTADGIQAINVVGAKILKLLPESIPQTEEKHG